MQRLTALCILWLGVFSGTPAAAQIVAPGPPGPYVIDVRGALSAIPQDAGFFPPVPTGTIIPARGFGVDAGAHVYLVQLGPTRLGIGASALRVRGTASPTAQASGSTSATPPPATTPDVNATLTILGPQLSFNFGSAAGWSYVSAGVGRAKLTAGTSAFGGGASGTPMTSPQSVDSGTRSSTNVGGGARWFVTAHMAFSFDIRFHFVSASASEGAVAATPRTALAIASVGISLR